MSASPEPGWHDDPSGLYAGRYWDGTAWTSWVHGPDGQHFQEPTAVGDPNVMVIATAAPRPASLANTEWVQNELNTRYLMSSKYTEMEWFDAARPDWPEIDVISLEVDDDALFYAYRRESQ